uniref:Pyruvate dehydrogenase E1 component subunit alpha n=2 Tax=Neospora caninum (strain Liverpool) TaxID=572307 RepID=A0A0F7UR91_NEOCL|nr:TPA: pyruvate dehydrogenase, putative [Neospora caninum Liverpool]
MVVSGVSRPFSREANLSLESERRASCHVASATASLPSVRRPRFFLLFLTLAASTFPRFMNPSPASALNPFSTPSSIPTAFSSANSLPPSPRGARAPRVRSSRRLTPQTISSQSSERLSSAFVASGSPASLAHPASSPSSRPEQSASPSAPASPTPAPSTARLAAVHLPQAPQAGDLSDFSAAFSSGDATGASRFASDRVATSTAVAAGKGAGETGSFSPTERDCLSPQQQHRELVSPYVGQMLLEDMLTGRMVEDACARLYYMGKTAGFVHLYTGQEAVSSGVIKLLRPDDAVVSTYRDHVHATSKGVPVREVMAELFGKATGCSKGRGGSMHMFSKEHNMIGGFAFIGEQIPVALGYAFSAAYRRFAMGDKSDPKADQVAVCFLGDGTTNMGQLYEALNIAALSKLPIIFVVENNNWAIGMAAQRSTAIPAVWQRAESFGVAGVEVDGMDVLAVRGAARRAIDRARRGEGPTLIEALTYRFRGHSVADPDEMRAVKQKEAWVVRDPIKSFEEELKRLGYANDETIAATRTKVKALVDDAVKFAETSPDPDVQECGQFIFAPPYADAGKPEPLTKEQLHEYAVALKQELDAKARVKAGDKTPQPSVLQSDNPPIVID